MKLNLYSFFHLNLMYSSIEEEDRSLVIEKCYWPLLDLAKKGFPVGIEAPAVTLEAINEIDGTWISTIKSHIQSGQVEFIGSGYSQIIGPLVPYEVNRWNQILGLEVYDQLLNTTPRIALVNEMAYSAGMVDQYIEAGYKAMIMEWNNPRHGHPEWQNKWRYYPQRARGTENTSIPLIWADSIAFQKFQRYAHGEYDLEDYTKYLESHAGEESRYFPLYANDAEIFDFRPGRYQTEATVSLASEWHRIIQLFEYLYNQNWCQFVLPSDILSGLTNVNGGNEIQLESPAQPIPVKKQEKYNINRWALTGRDDIGINTKCYVIYDGLLFNKNKKADDWKELCYLWSSDFRTHITDKRWDEYFERLNNKLAKYIVKNIKESREITSNVEISEDDKWIKVENDNYKIILNKNKGLTTQDLVFKKYGAESLLGTLDHGYYDDISLGADYYSGHAIIERPGEHKETDLGKVKPVFRQNGVGIVSIQKCGNYSFNQKIIFENEKIVFEKQIKLNSAEKAIIRPFNFTFYPNAWDKKSLYVETHNGGPTLERFYLKDQNIFHGDIYSTLISARHGFGNTGGIFIVGDKDKSIKFRCDMTNSALLPSIIYKEMNSTFFFRLQYSAREMDETTRRSKLDLSMKIGILGINQ